MHAYKSKRKRAGGINEPLLRIQYHRNVPQVPDVYTEIGKEFVRSLDYCTNLLSYSKKDSHMTAILG